MLVSTKYSTPKMRQSKALNVNQMHTTLKKWLRELEDETTITKSSSINEEAHNNMVTFGLSEESLGDWGVSSVVEFLESCCSIYRSRSPGQEMCFYAWFDEQAGQIRISAVSQSHNKLPFRCQLNMVELNEMVQGVFETDSGLFSREALDVWRKNI